MITALVSRKGGVGKTTTAVSLAAALARRGRRLLVIDLDPNAGASLSLGVARQDLDPGSGDLLLRDIPAAALVRASAVPNLDVIPASVDLRAAEIDLHGLRAKETVLGRVIEPLAAAYDAIFLDCPSALGLVTRNALAAADGYVVPATPQFLALDGLEQLIAAVERLEQRCGTRTPLIGIALTMVDYRISTTRRTLTSIRRRFGSRVFAMEVRVNVSLAEAPAFGQSIYEYNSSSTGARAYHLLAEEFLLQCQRLGLTRREESRAVAGAVG